MIPWRELDAVFLDAGNTLVSIDFELVAEELLRLGVKADPSALRRAEAAARPYVSRRAAERGSTEGKGAFAGYLRCIVRGLAPVAAASEAEASRLARALADRLHAPGRSDRLWRSVLPGVPEALEALRGLGLTLLVVSNSDGTVERLLGEVGLRPFFCAVVDSALVGYEKPDPRIFEHALGRAGVAKGRALHVGDLYHADVRGARAAGVHAVLLDPFDDWREVDCERVSDLGELARRLCEARLRRSGV